MWPETSQPELTAELAWRNAAYCGTLAQEADTKEERALYRRLNKSWVHVAVGLSAAMRQVANRI